MTHQIAEEVSVPYWLWFALLARAAYEFFEAGCEGDATLNEPECGLCPESVKPMEEWCHPCAARATLAAMAEQGDAGARIVCEDIEEALLMRMTEEPEPPAPPPTVEQLADRVFAVIAEASDRGIAPQQVLSLAGSRFALHLANKGSEPRGGAA
jgi:hypothetical protein